MHYLINVSEESDQLLRQLCKPRQDQQSEAISPEEFLSAFVEEQFNELFARRVQRKTEKNKKLDNTFRSAKERGKAWSEAAVGTHIALEALRKLVTEAMAEKPRPLPATRGCLLTCGPDEILGTHRG